MRTLLRIDASARVDGSHSRLLADKFQSLWLRHNESGEVISRDIAKVPLPHLSEAAIDAFHDIASDGDESAQASEMLIDEIKGADHILISSPLYNLSLPSSLKAYFDHVVRAKKTFDIKDGQFTGLLKGKSATVITSRGCVAQPAINDDYQTEYLKAVLGYIGIEDVSVVACEGTAIDEGKTRWQLQIAERQLESLFHECSEIEWFGEFTTLERQKISDLRSGQAQAIVNGDAEAYRNLCSEEIVLLAPGHDVIVGTAKFYDMERALFKNHSFKSFTKYPVKIERSGNTVIEVGRQTVQMESKKTDGGLFAASQKYMHVYKLTDAGWKFTFLMSNQIE